MANGGLQYLKNVLSSTGRTIGDVSRDLAPNIASSVIQAKEAIKTKYELKGTEDDPKKRVIIKNTFLYKSLDSMIKNAIEDLKTGNFNNTTRTSKDTGLAGEFNDLFNFDGFFEDENFFDEEDNPIADDNSDNVVNNNININQVDNDSNNNLSNGMQTISNLSVTDLKLKQNTFSILDIKMSKLINFNETQTLKFYNDITEKIATITDSTTLVSNYYRALAESSKETKNISLMNEPDYSNSSSGFSDILSMTGIDTYGFKELFKKSSIGKGKGELVDLYESFGKGMLSDLAKNPLQAVGKGIIKTLIPNKFKNKLKVMDNIYESLPMLINQKLGKLKNSDNFILKFFADNFYQDPTKEQKLDFSGYNKESMPWNGIAQDTVVNVIPQLLGKILGAVSDNPLYQEELVWDKTSRTFTTAKQIREKLEEEFNSSADSFFLDEFKTGIESKITETKGDLSSKDQDDLKDILNKLIKNGNTIANDTTMEDLKDLSENKDLLKIILDYYGGLNTNKKLSFTKSLQNATNDYNQQFRDINYNDVLQQGINDKFSNYKSSKEKREEKKKEEKEKKEKAKKYQEEAAEKFHLKDTPYGRMMLKMMSNLNDPDMLDESEDEISPIKKRTSKLFNGKVSDFLDMFNDKFYNFLSSGEKDSFDSIKSKIDEKIPKDKLLNTILSKLFENKASPYNFKDNVEEKLFKQIKKIEEETSENQSSSNNDNNTKHIGRKAKKRNNKNNNKIEVTTTIDENSPIYKLLDSKTSILESLNTKLLEETHNIYELISNKKDTNNIINSDNNDNNTHNILSIEDKYYELFKSISDRNEYQISLVENINNKLDDLWVSIRNWDDFDPFKGLGLGGNNGPTSPGEGSGDGDNTVVKILRAIGIDILPNSFLGKSFGFAGKVVGTVKKAGTGLLKGIFNKDNFEKGKGFLNTIFKTSKNGLTHIREFIFGKKGDKDKKGLFLSVFEILYGDKKNSILGNLIRDLMVDKKGLLPSFKNLIIGTVDKLAGKDGLIGKIFGTIGKYIKGDNIEKLLNTGKDFIKEHVWPTIKTGIGTIFKFGGSVISGGIKLGGKALHNAGSFISKLFNRQKESEFHPIEALKNFFTSKMKPMRVVIEGGYIDSINNPIPITNKVSDRNTAEEQHEDFKKKQEEQAEKSKEHAEKLKEEDDNKNEKKKGFFNTFFNNEEKVDEDGNPITDLIGDTVKEKGKNIFSTLSNKFIGSKLGTKLAGTKIGGSLINLLGKVDGSTAGNTLANIGSSAIGSAAGGKIGGGLAGLLGKIGGGAATAGAVGKIGSIGGLLGKGAKGLLGKTVGILTGASPLGLTLKGIKAISGGIKGWKNANENFGLEDWDEASTGQKVSSALGGALSKLSFGLLNQKSLANGIHGAGSWIGDKLGFIKEDPVTGKKTASLDNFLTNLDPKNKDRNNLGKFASTGTKILDTVTGVGLLKKAGNGIGSAITGDKEFKDRSFSEKFESVNSKINPFIKMQETYEKIKAKTDKNPNTPMGKLVGWVDKIGNWLTKGPLGKFFTGIWDFITGKTLTGAFKKIGDFFGGLFGKKEENSSTSDTETDNEENSSNETPNGEIEYEYINGSSNNSSLNPSNNYDYNSILNQIPNGPSSNKLAGYRKLAFGNGKVGAMDVSNLNGRGYGNSTIITDEDGNSWVVGANSGLRTISDLSQNINNLDQINKKNNIQYNINNNSTANAENTTAQTQRDNILKMVDILNKINDNGSKSNELLKNMLDELAVIRENISNNQNNNSANALNTTSNIFGGSSSNNNVSSNRNLDMILQGF